VGIDQVLSDVGISKTAFYKHFESKEDLMLAVLEMQKCWLQETFRTMVRERGGDAPVGQLHALFDVVEQITESDEFHGCIFVKAVMEFPLPHDPAHVLASQSKQTIEDFVWSLAVNAGVSDPRGLAQELCLLMEGAYVTRHVSGNRRTSEIARRMAQIVIDARVPSGASASGESSRA
jgi:AcrR family transcriptional regulator